MSIEKAIRVHTYQVENNPTPDEYCLSFESTPELAEAKKIRGRLFGALSLQGKTENLKQIAEELKEGFIESYFADLTGGILHRLEESLHLGERKLEGLQLQTPQAQLKLNLAVAILWGKILYLLKKGNGKVFIIRGGSILEILKEEEEKSSASGWAQDQDLIILGSFNIKEKVDLLEVAKDVSGKIEETKENLKAEPLGLMVLKIEELEYKEEVVLEKKEKRDLLAPLKNIFLHLPSFLPKRKIGLKVPETQVPKVSFNLNRTLRLLFFLGFLILFLILSFSVYSRLQKNKEDKFVKLKSTITADIDQAKDLAAIGSPEAKTLLDKIKKDLDSAASLNEKETQSLNDEYEKVLNSVLKIVQIEPELVFDLKELEKDAHADFITIKDEDLFILAKNSATFYKIDLSEKSGEVIFKNEVFKETFGFMFIEDYLYIAGTQGFYRYDLTKDQFKREIEKDEEWGTILDATVYVGNLYLLDDSGKIWKYSEEDGEFGSKINYLEESHDFKNATSLAVDGAIYVLFKEGRVVKFLRGKKEDFTLKNLPRTLEETIRIKTTADLKNLYVLDKKLGLILLFDKEGNYLSSYFSPSFKEAKDFQVSSDGKQVYLINDSLIYVFEIK